MENPEGTFNEPKPVNMGEWTGKANKDLAPYNRKVVNASQHNLLKYSVVIFALFVLILGYLGVNDKFKSEDTFTCPDIPKCDCPACPAFPNISMPDCVNNCQMPSSIQLNLTNHS